MCPSVAFSSYAEKSRVLFTECVLEDDGNEPKGHKLAGEIFISWYPAARWIWFTVKHQRMPPLSVGDGVWSLNPCSKDVDEVKHPCSKDVGDSKEVKKPKSDKPKAEELCEKPITRGQEKALEKFFKKTKYPTAQQKAVLTKTLKLTKIQVVNWFWNRRVKMRTEDELRLKSRTQDEIKQDELKLKTFEYQCRILAPSKQSCIVAPSAYHPYPMPHLWAPVHAPNTPFYHRQPVFHQPLQNPYYQSPGFFPLPLPHQPVMGNTGLEPYNPFQLERNMGLSGQQQF
ncbi:intestine-specific homeobox-like [Hyperolius riggenbachi]|uniref:intestine-specific homeobox-like n=1 Tax=Hyperolius riggenbachi TaxID=752182 RepID=UPI0035A35B1E